MDRWVLKIQGLEEKKKHYEQVLRRELDGLDDEFSTLKLLAQDLQVRTRNLRNKSGLIQTTRGKDKFFPACSIYSFISNDFFISVSKFPQAYSLYCHIHDDCTPGGKQGNYITLHSLPIHHH